MGGLRQAVVTGVGAITALGPDVDLFFSGLVAGRVGTRPVTLFPIERFRAHLAGEVEEVPEDPLVTADPRGFGLALGAAKEALGGRWDLLAGRRAAIVVGTTLGANRAYAAWLKRRSGGGAPGEPSELSMCRVTRELARRGGARGRCSTVSVACASGAAAVGIGASLIRRDEADIVLAGGYDALSDFVFAGFDSLRALSVDVARPFDARRDGLVLGEGAGFLLLEELSRANSRGARPIARVSGYASAADSHHMTRPSPSGEGLVRAIVSALRDGARTAEDVGLISTHGTATVFNDRMEATAFRAALGERAGRIPVNSIKGAIGHTLGAAGALEAIMTAKAIDVGLFPPTANFEVADAACPLDVVSGEPRRLPDGPFVALSTSSAFAGTNVALILERVT